MLTDYDRQRMHEEELSKCKQAAEEALQAERRLRVRAQVEAARYCIRIIERGGEGVLFRFLCHAFFLFSASFFSPFVF